MLIRLTPCPPPLLQTTLFVGNLTHDNEAELRSEMLEYGDLERCFIVTNAAGASKGYAFVEYTHPK